MSFVKLAICALAVSATSPNFAFARDNVHAAGSSTVLPYATIVAEAFGENFDFPTPLIESGGQALGARSCAKALAQTQRTSPILQAESSKAILTLARQMA